MSKKRKKKQQSAPSNWETLDESRLLDSNYFYWAVIRPGEEEGEVRRQKRTQRKTARLAKAAKPKAIEPALIESSRVPENEEELTQSIDAIIRTTHHAYGWRHLGELGQQLRQQYPGLQWSTYGCKKLIDFLQKYPEIFEIKWSAPAHKGTSSVWVRLAQEPKRKEAI